MFIMELNEQELEALAQFKREQIFYRKKYVKLKNIPWMFIHEKDIPALKRFPGKIKISGEVIFRKYKDIVTAIFIKRFKTVFAETLYDKEKKPSGKIFSITEILGGVEVAEYKVVYKNQSTT